MGRKVVSEFHISRTMAPMKKGKKAMKAAAKAMSKGAIAEALAAGGDLKKGQCANLLDKLAEVATANVKKAGVFTIPGLARLKIRTKPAKKIVKAFPVAALKASI